MNSKSQKLAAIKSAESELNKQYKTETTFQTYNKRVHKPVPCIPTNLVSVDRGVFGCGGWPRGRVIEVYGPESAGKTAICLHTIGQCQRAGGVAAFVDAEHALSATFAHRLGVDMDELVISQPDYGEQALEIVDKLVEKQAVDLIVVDSVTALVPKAEIDGEMGDSHMGLQARLMSQAMRKLVGATSKNDVTIIFINQIREKVGMVFGNPEVTTGGRALKFYSSLRVEVRRIAGKEGFLKEGDTIVGHRMRIKAQKNKVGSPFRETEVNLYYDNGFDINNDIVEYGQSIGVVEGSAWLTLKSDKLGEKFRRDDLVSNDHVTKVTAEINAYHLALDKKIQEQMAKEAHD